MVDNGLWQGALRGGGGGKRTDVLGSKTGKKAPAVHLSPARRQKIRIEQKLEEHRRRRIGRALRRHEVRQQRLAPPHDNAVPTEDVAVVYTLGDARSRSCPPVVASYGDGVAAAGGRPLDLRAVVSRTRQLRTKWSQYQEPASRMPVLGDPDAAGASVRERCSSTCNSAACASHCCAPRELCFVGTITHTRVVVQTGTASMEMG
jgi:hypothetical protein|eukprot:COSAG01_NODE_694_length_14205_cov_228.163122_9_plen_204_part_00